MHYAYRHGYAVGACGVAGLARSRQEFWGAEPKFAEPTARPEGAVRCTAAKLVSDPNNSPTTIEDASARQQHETAVLLGQPAFPPLKYEITKRFGRR